MLKPAKRKGSPNFYARGTYLGERVFESLGTSDLGQAERLLAKLQNDIFEKQARGGVQPVEGFVSAATRYMESGGERRFVAPLLLHFGDVPVDRIDQQAIDRGAVAIYPACSPATRNRRVFTPLSAILKFVGVTRNIRRPKAPPGNRPLADTGRKREARCRMLAAPSSACLVSATHRRSHRQVAMARLALR